MSTVFYFTGALLLALAAAGWLVESSPLAPKAGRLGDWMFGRPALDDVDEAHESREALRRIWERAEPPIPAAKEGVTDPKKSVTGIRPACGLSSAPVEGTREAGGGGTTTFYCTLPEGHGGRHRCDRALSVRVWDDVPGLERGEPGEFCRVTMTPWLDWERQHPSGSSRVEP